MPNEIATSRPTIPPAAEDHAVAILLPDESKPNAQAFFRPPGLSLDEGIAAALADRGWPRAQKAFLRLLRKAHQDRFFRERIARLRDAILLSTLRRDDATRGIVIGVSSPRGREGVSVLSLLLGLSLSQCSSRRVGFLDGRLDPARFSILTTAFGLARDSVSLENGFGEIVGFCNADTQNLCFLTSAKSECGMYFFSDKRLPAFFESLRATFDFCVVDMPPLLSETLALFSLPHVDRLYLVVEAGKTRISELGRAIEVAEKIPQEVTGVIVNKQRTPLWARLFWREFFF